MLNAKATREIQNLNALYVQVTKQVLAAGEGEAFLYQPEQGEIELVKFPRPNLSAKEFKEVESSLASLGASHSYLQRLKEFYLFLETLPRNSKGLVYPRRTKDMIQQFLLVTCPDALGLPEIK